MSRPVCAIVGAGEGLGRDLAVKFVISMGTGMTRKS